MIIRIWDFVDASLLWNLKTYTNHSHLQKRIFGFQPDFAGFCWILLDFIDLVDFLDFKPKIQTEGFTASRMAAVDLQTGKETSLGFAARQRNFPRICSQAKILCSELQPPKVTLLGFAARQRNFRRLRFHQNPCRILREGCKIHAGCKILLLNLVLTDRKSVV